MEEIFNINFLKANKKPLQGVIKTNDNLYLAYAMYTSRDVQACMIFYHGSGAHRLAGYTLMAEQLCKHYKIATCLIDIRGHGSSEGKRGHTPSVEQVWEDISSVVLFFKQKFKDVPIYLGGHSSGAGLVLNYANWKNRLSVDAYVFVAPEFGHRVPIKHDYLGNEQFSKLRLLPIIANKLTMRYLFGSCRAVIFNYSKEVIEKNVLVGSHTVNMYRAIIPENPIRTLENLEQPSYIIISERDELFDSKKLEKFLMPVLEKNSKILFDVVSYGGHISIFKDIYIDIGNYFVKKSRLTPSL